MTPNAHYDLRKCSTALQSKYIQPTQTPKPNFPMHIILRSMPSSQKFPDKYFTHNTFHISSTHLLFLHFNLSVHLFVYKKYLLLKLSIS